jgi:DNA-binding protein HU-beta
MPRKATISGVKECAKGLAAKRKCTLAEAKEIVEDVLGVIDDELMRTKGVQFVGRWTVEAIEKSERMGRNPQTGEQIVIPKRVSIKFKLGKALKDRLNGLGGGKGEVGQEENLDEKNVKPSNTTRYKPKLRIRSKTQK